MCLGPSCGLAEGIRNGMETMEELNREALKDELRPKWGATEREEERALKGRDAWKRGDQEE